MAARPGRGYHRGYGRRRLGKRFLTMDKLIIRGAREHNLKGIDVEIPRDRLVVITGISGSGKSSLAFDTIYAEGQRRYVESLSAYARQFLGLMQKPDVDFIEGLSPAIAIDQKSRSHNPRSTVGTVTEIHDYLRLLFARIGHPHCPQCGQPIERQTAQQITDQVMALPEGTAVQIMAPVIQGRKGEYKNLFDDLKREGFVRVRVDGALRTLYEQIELDRNKRHNVEIVLDRIKVTDKKRSRIGDSIETALRYGQGLAIVEVVGQGERLYSEHFACTTCGVSLPEIEPRLFSFNSPFGACPTCDGLGVRMVVDPDLVIDPRRSLREGGLLPWASTKSRWIAALLDGVCRAYAIDPNRPLGQLPPAKLHVLLYGTDGEPVEFTYTTTYGRTRVYQRPFEGLIPTLERNYREATSEEAREGIEQYLSALPCEVCRGARLRPEALAVTVGGKSLWDVTRLPVREALAFFTSLELTEREQLIAHQILKEVRSRLQFMVDVGLDYLTLDRSAGTLAGGEAQRIRLATQIGSQLTGVLYVLDEPSVGLHARDNRKLLSTLKRLRDLGNTVLVVEHDEETMREADYLVDLGPGAGIHGGYVVATGTPDEVAAEPRSLTGQYLAGTRRIPIPSARRRADGRWLVVRGAREHNLKGIDVRFPVGLFTCITGVSGSGKSTLAEEILYRGLAWRLGYMVGKPGLHDGIEGAQYFDKAIEIDQSPIGRTPRSNPATYTKAFDPIREMFAATPEARMRGYEPGRFSFNVRGGRCEACQGQGKVKIEMHFLPDVYVPCEVCHGTRYNTETLAVRYKGRTIAEVLEMTVEEALGFFSPIPPIREKLQTLYDVGLGYIKLGQPATELSGGEAQRVKLARELARRATGRTLYVLDEPTTGLHPEDVRKLLSVLHRLVDVGNTVVVIEHNLDVVKTADWIIDLGPEGGEEGGRVIAEGPPEAVVGVPASYTGQFLRGSLALSEVA
ncbi:ATPase and DNA damage recognition protein of nucleotide excision repair excinuclease UvrABC [Candidatus Bipolaricaulis anaerobius]|uniref:UvrABC system protein A n=2 Tax=Candidatus Bipolaricaulis anaerobius TaxID=2026885 RepID=A0A2X3KUS1_9BACT|nr:ATPase and DNA damage recognition protein of nucleotide excision repair excinuclease UvrABC [Candidatus Bipolaricaulis anaerobius]